MVGLIHSSFTKIPKPIVKQRYLEVELQMFQMTMTHCRCYLSQDDPE